MPLERFNPGDKIDIKVVKNINQIMGNQTVLIFKSSIFDINEDGSIRIAMPTQAGKTILFPVGTDFEAIVYTKKGLFSVDCMVRQRFNDDGLLTLDVDLVSDIKKFQRREFFRLSKLIDVSYFRIPLEEGLEIEEQYQKALLTQPNELLHGTIVNISGGGVKLLLSHPLEKDELILVKFFLSDSNDNKLYQLMAQTIECEISERIKNKYAVRLKFVALDKSIQDTLIKQIFLEERKIIKKV
ncbi:flagellar brake protein [Eubacterium oxidoreducens]|uniref:C-di-GMP-binding flagellar brake protein YcgR, contains PilZNR and PilZ domains n=1 Tax=Eubacterium oxidoreducens TaxID=1732 RepID=A0A1G6API4_EUBOX|nr:flagellar brake domain-containing protein [Eubacterium oxidoreducens]SDB10346.1 c-di-GMP-binding flagellar brake protein YcgR, contains PilZNR and PilZ domains [Eubacterium oxidoreducens]